jgi:hypothetical protein
MGWRETNRLDHTSSDGSMSPQPDVIEIVYPSDDDEETTH